ncbi:hypothetical protein POX_c04747 [Penicillium oxalicum]|uniref:Uncharacterized protein n=1 Tax=Penicillium oxalicum (strain 114-2 / CGMCC 5302) TaxID=933388 RepID=S8AKC5_PENO1|nr:hypothetical protein POX_c04747 [Penicillium oxalicum]EPS26278.1 hypothetical protein PDE_01214 [Penicillium oxalicum 114-2]KAI2791867.1 hypothetical protein POX_c04747 [Penicillium oxalicum]
MHAEGDSMLVFTQWHDDDTAGADNWAGSNDHSLPELDLLMTVSGQLQDESLTHPGTFFMDEYAMTVPADAALPSVLAGTSPNQLNSPASSLPPQTRPNSIPDQPSQPGPNSSCCSAHERIVHLLLSNGANVNVQNANGQTPLHIAAQHGHIGIVRLLLASKFIDVNIQDHRGATPLHLASENGHAMVVTLLVEHNARLDVRTTSV